MWPETLQSWFLHCRRRSCQSYSSGGILRAANRLSRLKLADGKLRLRGGIAHPHVTGDCRRQTEACHRLHTQEVTGSGPVAPTMKAWFRAVLIGLAGRVVPSGFQSGRPLLAHQLAIAAHQAGGDRGHVPICFHFRASPMGHLRSRREIGEEGEHTLGK
jgi:hypothetical protein